jgi:hypothetical protein
VIGSTSILRAIPAAAVAIVAALLNGCGGDDSDGAAEETEPATPEAAEEGQPLSPVEERGRERRQLGPGGLRTRTRGS